MLNVPTYRGFLNVPGSIYPRLSPGMKGTDIFPDSLLGPPDADKLIHPQGLLQTGSCNFWWTFFLSSKNKQANSYSKTEYFVSIKQILRCKFVNVG